MHGVFLKEIFSKVENLDIRRKCLDPPIPIGRGIGRSQFQDPTPGGTIPREPLQNAKAWTNTVVGQHLRCLDTSHPTLVYFKGFWDVHQGTRPLKSHMISKGCPGVLQLQISTSNLPSLGFIPFLGAPKNHLPSRRTVRQVGLRHPFHHVDLKHHGKLCRRGLAKEVRSGAVEKALVDDDSEVVFFLRGD